MIKREIIITNNQFFKRTRWISYILLEKDLKGTVMNRTRYFIIGKSHEITPSVPLNMINHEITPSVPLNMINHEITPSVPLNMINHEITPSVPLNIINHESNAYSKHNFSLIFRIKNWIKSISHNISLPGKVTLALKDSLLLDFTDELISLLGWADELISLLGWADEPISLLGWAVELFILLGWADELVILLAPLSLKLPVFLLLSCTTCFISVQASLSPHQTMI